MSKKDKLNLLIVTAFPVHGAGSGALVTTQATSYVKEGHNVHIITANNRSDFPKVEGVDYHLVPFTAETESPEVIDGQLPFNYPMFTTHTESTATFWNLSLDQIKAYEDKFRQAMQDEIETFKPDVLHGQHNWLANAIATEFDIPIVVTIHGTDLMGYKRSKAALKDIMEQLKDKTLSPERIAALKAEADKYIHFAEMAKKSANGSHKVIVISEDQKQQFCELFPEAADKVELVKNGYTPEKFHVMENVDKEAILGGLTSDRTPDGKIPTDYDNMALFVGKFADFKGIDVLLDAAKKYEGACKAEGKKPLTIIVGTGALEADLKAQADRLELENTHFVGLQTPDVIRPLQNLADVSLIPSRSEPFGLVVIEGTACGHPVIGTNSGGIPDIMNITGKVIKQNYDSAVDGQDEAILAPDAGTTGTYTTPLGILVPVDDSDALADAVMDIFDGRKQFNGEAIAKYTRDTYSQEVITEHLIGLFNQVAEDYQNSKPKAKVLTRKASTGPSMDDDL